MLLPVQLQDELQTAIAKLDAALLALKKEHLLTWGPRQCSLQGHTCREQRHRHAHAFRKKFTKGPRGQVPSLWVEQS